MLLLQTNDQTKAKEQTPTTGAAADLHYEDAIRRATYTTNAHLSGTQGDLTADKIELYLDETGDEVERIEGYKTVNLLTTDGRRATGDRMTYFASDERYVMKGVPVKIIEECRETTGKTLTFFKSTDRIIVDGNEETRTQTKGGTKCGEPRFD
jgi:lipopolysaccharide export system protein LptA